MAPLSDIDIEGGNENYKKDFEETQNPHSLMIKVDEPKLKISPTISYESQHSVVSNTVSTVSSEEANYPWPYDHYAKNYVIGLITIFYAVIFIVYNITLCLWFWNLDETDKVAEKLAHKQFTGFSYYSYVTGLAFFAYCYILILLKPRRWKETRQIFHKFFPNHWKQSSECEENERVMPDIGCLYLRYGAVIFAIVSAVFFAYSASLHTLYFEADVLATIFIIVQTHFIYCSSTMFNPKHDIISRFGTMHLVSVNFNHAFQFIFEKTQANQKSIGKVFKINKTASVYLIPVATSTMTTTVASTTATSATTTTEDFSSNSSEEKDVDNSTTLIRVARAAAQIITSSDGKVYVAEDCSKTIECILGSFTKVFYTAVIEYSIIATAIFFIVWHNIERIQGNELTHEIQKKSTIRINCSKMVIGLFAGYGFVIGTFISMVLFYGYYGQSQYFNAANTYNTTDIIQHCIGFVACVFALWRIRLLKFIHHNPHSHDPHYDSHSNQELLDMILLAVGLVGELCFSISTSKTIFRFFYYF